MDIYLISVRNHLKLVARMLDARLAEEQQRPVGMLLRHNRISHTKAMQGLVGVVREMARHDPEEWWADDEDHPF